MPSLIFPHPDEATEEGLLAVGGILDTPTLLSAYEQGIFPWPLGEQYPLTWFSPDPRGILFFDELHIPHSLQKFIKKTNYKVYFNRDFETVIKACAHSKRQLGNQTTWILPPMIEAYVRLFDEGYAFCVEIEYDNKLAGGLYGVNLGHTISGESMFHFQDHASKIALIELVKHLKEKNFHWIDTQMVTPVTGLLGAREIPRKTFLSLLKENQKRGLSKAKIF